MLARLLDILGVLDLLGSARALVQELAQDRRIVAAELRLPYEGAVRDLLTYTS
jgi:hypothetical protein